uniref:Histone acetyltransferase n=1 Tax=Panagrolaimus sp. ES5 TaxID=591445 RepID=A0AC34GSZ7_9BILA
MPFRASQRLKNLNEAKLNRAYLNQPNRNQAARTTLNTLKINIKGQSLEIVPKPVPKNSSLKLSMKERLDALNEFAIFSPCTTLLSVKFIIDMLEKFEFQAYRNSKTKTEYLAKLSGSITAIFPKTELSENANGERYVSRLSSTQLKSITDYIVNGLKSSKYQLLTKHKDYNTSKTGRYEGLQDFSSAIQQIILTLKDSDIRATSKAAEKILSKYAIDFDPIFQHSGLCCSGKAVANQEDVYTCKICEKFFHGRCENYCPVVDGNSFFCRQCKKFNGINIAPKKSFKDMKQNLATKTMEANIRKLIAAKGVITKPVNVRMIYNNDRSFKTHPSLVEDFAYPESLEYRKKIFIAFQEVENSETLLFYFEVHEYDDESLPPNQRVVYLSYLDSLGYFTPENNKELRRGIYYTIIQTYLKYAREMKFVKAYLWMLPPKQNEEFCFYGHPDPYIVPNIASLRNFYKTLLDQAIEKKFIKGYDYIEKTVPFQSKNFQVKDIPYFDGDLWCEEIAKSWKKYDDQKSKKKAQFPIRLLSDCKKALKAYKETMIIVNLYSPAQSQKVRRSKLMDLDTVSGCKLLDDREDFFEFQMKSNYAFDTIENNHFSTKMLYVLISQPNERI